MPLYDWKNNETGEEFENFLTIAEREQFVKDNPHLTQIHKKFTPVSGVGGIKTDESFKDILRNINHTVAGANIRVD